MRNAIKEKLLEIDPLVYYGLVNENEELDEWNYLVFGQKSIRKSGTSGNDLNRYWYVAIVRENFIPDETVEQVIDNLCDIPGLRLADDEFEYSYMLRGGTNIVVEMVVLRFTKTKKRCK